MKFAKKIQELREYFNDNNSGLERILGLSNGYLSKFEKDKIDNPSKLLSALASNGISTDWFLFDKGPIINIPLPSELEKMALEAFNSPAAKFLRDYIEKNPELIKIQIEEAERALETYNRLYEIGIISSHEIGLLDGKGLSLEKPQNRLDEYKPIISTEPQNRLDEYKPIISTEPTDRLNSQRKPDGIPLIYEGAEGLEDGIVIPLLENAASAGYGSEVDDNDTPVRYIQVPHHLSKYPHLACLPVKGDSMEPTLHDGDLVVCDGGGWDGDGIYVLKTHDTAYVKRVQLKSDGYRVISDNKMYESITESVESLSIVGKVRAILVIVPGRRGGV